MADLRAVSGYPGTEGKVRAASGRSDPGTRERIAIFAEVLGDIGGVRATCRRIGIPYRTGRRYLARIRAELGPQAA